MTAARFQNMLRIMHGLDEVDTVLDRPATAEFHRDPMRAALRMDAPTWAKVFALIENRQPK